MSKANTNWPRWIFASVSKHFYDYSQVHELDLFIEGQTRQPSTDSDYTEFRFDGPSMQEISNRYWSINMEVNILIVSFINEEDFHKIHRSIGLVSGAFTCIPIMTYGDDPTVQIGVMDTVQQGRDRILITQFGQVAADSRMLQATVEASYNMKIYE